jgi:hypothetical protein
LDSSQVAQLPEPEGINERIAQLRQQAAPRREAYERGQQAYEDARAAYVSAAVAASLSAAKRLEFRSTGAGLRSKMAQAKENWEIEGAKTEYENILAEIASLRSKRSPAIWRTEALKEYDNVPQGEDATFGEARLTWPFPGSFATNPNGWMTFAMGIENVDSLSKTKSTKWSVDGSVRWGSFKLDASASGSTTESLAINNTDNFSIKLSVAQIPLIRTWIDPWYLRSEFWRFNPASIEGQSNKPVSDGGSPPSGLLVGYPVSAIFIRDVEIIMAELNDETSELVKTLKGEAKVGWGLGALNISGSYERNSQEKRHKAHVANGKLTAPGLSLVGLVIESIGQSPKQKEGLTWVGG